MALPIKKYSILLPVHNGGHLVKACVNSILAQTLDAFDLLVLDNDSTDGSREWIQSLNDHRIKIFPSDKKITIEENWGRIKEVQKNEFITFLGHDDILYPNFLETIDRLITEHPTASLYHTHFNFINAEGKIIRQGKPMQGTIAGTDLLKAILTNTIDAMGTGYIMRSKDYDELQGIPVRYPNLLFADYELWLKLTYKSFEVVATENCFAFRVHQSTTNTTLDKNLHKALAIFIDFLVSIEKQDEASKKIIQEYGAAFLLRNCKSFAHRLLRTPFEKRKGNTVSDFVEFTKTLSKKLSVEGKYKPNRLLSIKLASIIDSNIILRKLFLLFKKIHPKPVIK
jgi:glycosyltransferase involved in cell wall biosynthesis